MIIGHVDTHLEIEFGGSLGLLAEDRSRPGGRRRPEQTPAGHFLHCFYLPDARFSAGGTFATIRPAPQAADFGSMKPFRGTHETNLKQFQRRCLSNKWCR